MTTKSSGTNGAVADSHTMELCLRIDEALVYTELSAKAEGDERNAFAIHALKIGVLALQQAQGTIDTDGVRQEADRLLERLTSELNSHPDKVTKEIGTCLTTYFDPQSGQFTERVNRLIAKDGDLETVLRSHLDGETSTLVRMLGTHVGSGSPLMRALDTESNDGFAAKLTQGVELVCKEQNDAILKEFSRDNNEGALSRFLEDLTKNNGDLTEALRERIEQVAAEFSLDKDDSALSMFLKRVEKAQSKVSSELSLDNKDSALTRMRDELLKTFEEQDKKNQEHQQTVISMLSEMKGEKQEAERSTRHGLTFEDAVWDFIEANAREVGDIPERTGNSTGISGKSKKGDAVIELGRDAVAAGAKIVFEAKANSSYTLKDALQEIEDARKNRGASVGVFVFASDSAPIGLERVKRYGDDIVLVWDANESNDDVVFDAGVSIARALCTRTAQSSASIEEHFNSIERAIRAVEQQVRKVDEIKVWATTIKTNAEHIVKNVDKVGGDLRGQITILDESVAGLRPTL